MFGLLDMIGLGSKPAADEEATTDDGPRASWERSVKSDDLAEGGRQCLRLESGRGVLLVRYEGVVHCLDHSCYHRAAPLVHGDIEDLDGQSYIICPLHDYKISLTTGEALAKKKPPGEPAFRLISKGFNQRIHQVHEGTDAPRGVSTPSGVDSWIWVRETTPAAVREVVHSASIAGTEAAVTEAAATEAAATEAAATEAAATEAAATEAAGTEAAATEAAATEAPVPATTDIQAGVETATTLGLKALRAAAKEEGEAGGPATTALAAARFNRAKLVRHEAPPEGWLKSDDCAHLVY